jgi:ribosomal protein L35AE/L33A
MLKKAYVLWLFGIALPLAQAAPIVQFSSATHEVNEGGNIITITVTISEAPDNTTTVDYNTSDGSATQPDDYITELGTLRWELFDSDNKTITVLINDDDDFEDDETFSMTLSNVTGGATIGDPATMVITIINDDEPSVGTLQFSNATYSVDENEESVEIIVNRVDGSDGDVSVECASSDNTATAGIDYVQTTSTLIWNDGDDESKACTVPILDDADFEGDETFNMALSNATGGASIGDPSIAEVTIVDKEQGTLQFSKAEYNVNENGGSIEIIVNRVNGKDGAISVNCFSSDGTATAGNDYIGFSDTLNWGDQEDEDKSCTVQIINDSDFEGDKTFNMTLDNATGGATIGDPNTAVVTIIEDEELPPKPGTLQFSMAKYSADEDVRLLTIAVNRINGTDGAVSVEFATTDGSATAGKDYIGISSVPLSWSDGDNSDRTLSITILNDSDYEDDETFNLTLSNPTGGAIIGDPGIAEATIIDDETLPSGILQFSMANYNVDEGGSIEITVTRKKGSNGAVSVKYITKHGTAKGKDYKKAKGNLKWEDGESGDKTFTVKTKDDEKAENDETVKLQLKKAKGGAELGDPAKAVLTIIDDDSFPGILQFSEGSYSVDEDGESVKIAVERIDGSNGKVSVVYTTSDDSATEGDDYKEKTGKLSWAHQDSADQTFKVRIIDDNKQEGNETFIASLGNPTNGAELGIPNTVKVEIIDDDNMNCANVKQIPRFECEALVALYLEAGGTDWNSNTNWIITETPCSWYGVACSGGHVSRLTLYSNNLKGNIPAELGDLTKLQRLFLFNNKLDGKIPKELGNLSQLEYLWLHENELCGNIPNKLMDTPIPPQEGYLKLNYNQLETDDISNDLRSWLRIRNFGWEYTQTGDGQCH